MIYVGIDVGIINLAIVKCQVEHFKIVTVLDARCVNLNEMEHQTVPRDQCTLQHSNDVYDKIQHLLQDHADLFQDVDQVRIERQPLGGLVHVEQLLFGHFRSKAKLISPNAMHKYFGIREYDYDGRKVQTTKLADPYLSHLDSWRRERVHDLADALCIVLYSLTVDRREDETSQRQIATASNPKFAGWENFFEAYRFGSLQWAETSRRTIVRQGASHSTPVVRREEHSSSESTVSSVDWLKRK